MNPRPFLTAVWRDLAVLNFEVHPSLLAPHLPAGTELDLWKGNALVSLVGFQFLDTKVFGLPIPFHRNFEEVNLRFYVRGALGRGVVFIREIAPRRAVAGVARLLYSERYVALPMEHAIERNGGRLSVSYGWKQNGRRNFFAVEAEGEPALPVGGSPEEFIFEHYCGYTRMRGGGSRAYRVDHPAWRVWTVKAAECDVDGDTLYGAGLGEVLRGPSCSAMLGEGSPVSVFRREM